MIRRPPRSTLFPYTSSSDLGGRGEDARSTARGDHGPRRRGGEEDGAPLRGVGRADARARGARRSEEHTSELQSQSNLVCRLLLEKKNTTNTSNYPVHLTATT